MPLYRFYEIENYWKLSSVGATSRSLYWRLPHAESPQSMGQYILEMV